MFPLLSSEMILERNNKLGISYFPDLLLTRDKCTDILKRLNEEHPYIFQGLGEVSPGIFALTRSRVGVPQPEQALVITPKGCTLTLSDPEYQRDTDIKAVTLSVVAAMRDKYPIKRIPRVGRIVELILKWPSEVNPHNWIRDNLSCFDENDDVDEVNFRFLHRTSGMNINTILNPVKHKVTGDWAMLLACDINNSDVSSDVTTDVVESIIDFSTLYFPDRTFEIINKHISE